VDLYIAAKTNKLESVVGLSREEAADQLETLGLRVSVVHSVAAKKSEYEKIVAMDVASGSEVYPGDEIKITLAHKGGWIYL
jgi:beta-lactam-binding protein with PASTA domain